MTWRHISWSCVPLRPLSFLRFVHLEILSVLSNEWLPRFVVKQGHVSLIPSLRHVGVFISVIPYAIVRAMRSFSRGWPGGPCPSTLSSLM